MNIDRIIKLAIEAKLLHKSETKEFISDCGVEVWISGQWGLDALEKFASLIASAEREACAKVCEEIYTGEEASSDWPTPEMCATAIRARGQA